MTNGTIDYYESAASSNYAVLRQGDVVRNVQCFGVINPNGVQMLTDPKSGQHNSWMCTAAPKFSDAVVLSHSCEIAKENEMKVTSIILAPMRDVSSGNSQATIDEIISTNLIDVAEPQAAYLKYFWLPPHDKIDFERGALVDYSKCFSVRKQYLDDLIERKALELKDSVRNSFGLKVGLYFARSSLLGIAG